MKIYIGCSLTQAPQEYKDAVDRIKDSLRDEYEILDFYSHGVSSGTPEDVYAHDIHTCIATCDAFIALCDLPAIGLGYELGVAVEKFGKPTLALAQVDAKISRLVLGITHPNYTFMRYESADDVPEKIRSFLKAL